jgi:hypothetical protein
MVAVTCKLRGVALCAALSGIILGAAAEVIQSPVGSQAPENQSLPRAVRGMSTDFVLEQFGLPESQSERIGNPAISIRRYPSYSVYFESATVIHSVLTHRPQVPVEPE